jgi:hypothetical protein
MVKMYCETAIVRSVYAELANISLTDSSKALYYRISKTKFEFDDSRYFNILNIADAIRLFLIKYFGRSCLHISLKKEHSKT